MKLLLYAHHFKIYRAGTLRLVKNGKKIIFFSFGKFFDHFLHLWRFWSIFQNLKSVSQQIFSQTNLLKYPNFLIFFWQNWNLWLFLTFMKILINFFQNLNSAWQQNFFQINHNLLKYPNFLNIFDRIKIYDMLSAIWDLPRGYSFFSLEIACK